MASKIIVDQVQKSGGTAFTLPTSDGADGTFMKTDGSGTLSFASAAAGFHQMLVKTASDATYSPDTGVTKLLVEVQGAGGGSGDTTGPTGTSSGAGGGYARVQLTVTSADVMNVQIGSGGQNATTTGGTGGASSFASVSGTSFTTITANGGVGGGLTTQGASGGSATGPAGGLYIPGGYGSMENQNSSGGHSWFGYGGMSTGTGNPQNRDGVGYGSGASQAAACTGIGADGADGLVVIWEYK